MNGGKPFSYSAAEQAEIEASVRHLWNFNHFRDPALLWIEIVLHVGYWRSPQARAIAAGEEESKAAEVVGLIDMLRERIGVYAELAKTDRDAKTDGLPEMVADAFAALRPIQDEFREKAKRAEGAATAASRLVGGPNARPFQQRLLRFIASKWTELGAEVSNSPPYRRYFQATVRPILISPDIQAATGCAWSESLFRNHVTSYLRAGEMRGARGRSRTAKLPPD